MNQSGSRAPRVVQGTIRQKAWRAMQVKGKFTVSDLVRNVVTAADQDKNPRNNISHYVKRLARAGILAELKRRAASTSLTGSWGKRWILIRDLGREAPVARHNGSIYDPNTGISIPVKEAESGHVK